MNKIINSSILFSRSIFRKQGVPNLKTSFFKSFSSENNQITEIIEEDRSNDDPYFSAKVPYKFSEKCIALPINIPLFPYAKIFLNVGDFKFKIYTKENPMFFTTIVKKEILESKKTVEKDVKKDETQNENILENYYKMGTYCSAEIDPKYPNTIVLQGIHRVEVLQIEKSHIPIEEQNETIEELKIDENTLANEINEDQSHPQENYEKISKENRKKNKSLPSEIKKILDQGKRSPKNLLIDEPYLLLTTIKKIEEPDFKLDIILETKLKHLIDIYSKILYLNKGQIPLVNYNLHEAYRLIDSLGGILSSMHYFKTHELQDAFEQIQVPDRLDKVHELSAKHLVFLQNFSDVGQIANQNLKAKKAQEFYEEVFKIVKGVVEGEKGKQGIISNLRKILNSKKPPEHVIKIFEEEIRKFESLDEMSSESNITRTYLDWLVSMPYGLESKDTFDIDYAKKILDEDHYGMDDIKDRILEFIAVGQLKGSLTGKILCLIGPPGVGKTSLAASIAKSLNRKYARVAMGGESDSAFLKGHRKTYIGAYPGKIIQAFKECQTENCVILLDEIDKLGKSEIHGDPQSNLLEILDPAQNNTFTDNYLDFPVDLSKALFICSANISDTISPPLLDRMDVIQLSSYTANEKKEIYTRHLLPRTGLNQNLFTIPENIVNLLVEDYCREPGVRGLDKYTKKMIEKIAYQLVRAPETTHITVDESLLVKYIGHPKFTNSRFYRETPIGVVIGLAYTEYGGSLIYIEAMQSSFFQSNNSSSLPGLKITGSLGGVMKESMQIAYTYAKSFASTILKNKYLEINEVHIHAPEGATPKDGPSAGITITSALISLLLKKQTKQNVAMTGEISLRGKVLKIGGVKEKILAAKREKIFEVILPKGNEEDVRELKDYVKEGMKFNFVENYEDVYRILFPEN